MRSLNIEDYFVVTRAARELGITRQGVHWMVLHGVLPARRTPWGLLIPKDAVTRLVIERQHKAAAQSGSAA